MLVLKLFEGKNDKLYQPFIKQAKEYPIPYAELYDAVIGRFRWVAVVFDDRLYNVKSVFTDAVMLDRNSKEFTQLVRVCELDAHLAELEAMMSRGQVEGAISQQDKTQLKLIGDRYGSK